MDKSLVLLGPPVAITQPRPLCFAAVSFCFFYSARDLRGLSADRREKLCHMIGNGCNFKNLGQNFGSSHKKKFGAEKHAFWRDFGRLRTSIVNISGMEQDIDNRKTALQTTISSAYADIIW